MADIRKTIEILFEGNDQASRKAADVIAKIREMETQAGATTGKTNAVAESLDNIGRKDVVISRAADAMRAFAGALIVDRFIDANVAIEKFERGIKAVSGASADTRAELAFVTGVAERLGVEVLVAADGYLKLTAATKGTSLEGQATREIFEAVTRAMSALGRSSDETSGALRAVEQIASKGKVSMEELRGQLGDRMPGAFNIAARAMGVTTVELEKLVEKGLPAEDFLRKFANELDRTFAGATFDGYVQALARLRNTIDEAFVDAGKAGAFDALITAIKAVTATVTGSISFIRLFGETLGNLAYTATSGDFSGFGTRFEESINKAANSTKSLTEALFGAEQAAKTVATALKFGDNQTDAETARLARMNQTLTDSARASSELDVLLKRLGVDPRKTTEAVAKLADDLSALASNPQSNGTLFSQAFEAALRRATTTEAVRILGERLAVLFNDGKISADAYKAGLVDLEAAFGRVDGSAAKAKKATDENAAALKRQAEETKKAEENAQKMRLELERLASNERIKNIEAKVKLNIAEIEADTKRVEAAFESINNTVNSTGDLLGDLFGLLKDYDTMSFRAADLIENQIELENQRRREALDMQKRLIEAQINQIRAQTRAVERGDSIIKVEGAGLQPHLEAFMWEILRKIQIRVNQNGLKMLLGV